MNIREAKQNLRDLGESLMVLVAATDGIKESDFEALQKRKDVLEANIADAQKRAKDASAFAEDKIAQAKADTDAKLADFKKQIGDAETALKNLRTELNVSREIMQVNIASEKAALLGERQAELKRLDETIAGKTKTLESLNVAIEEARKRFA